MRTALLVLCLLATPALAQLNAATRTRVDTTSAATTPVAIDGLSWTVPAEMGQTFWCVLTHQGTATSGPRFGVSGPASPTRVQIRWQRSTSTTAQTQSNDTAFSATAQTAAITTGGNTTILTSVVYGTYVTGATGGTVALHLTSSTAGQTVTVYRGSGCFAY